MSTQPFSNKSVHNEIREIEVRYRLSNREQIEESIRKLGAKLTNHSHVIDSYYCPVEIKSVEENDIQYESAKGYTIRIRETYNDYTEKVATSFEVKKLAGPDFKDHANCLEAEIDISNAEELKKLLSYINQKCFVKIDKERFIYRLDNVKFCLDIVKDWGVGLEIEKITNEDTQTVYKELQELASKVGLTEKDRCPLSFTHEIIAETAKF